MTTTIPKEQAVRHTYFGGKMGYSTHRAAKNMGDAVRLFCMECQGSMIEFDKTGKEVSHFRAFDGVKECPSEGTCSLWQYRFGKDPKRKGGRGNPDALRAFRKVAHLTEDAESGANG